MPTFIAIAAVIVGAFTRPRMPSVPKYLRVIPLPISSLPSPSAKETAVKYRTLGQGLEVSAIGIGCMPMVRGGNINYGGDATAEEGIATIQRAIDLGVTFFDTAEIYGPFQNEELVGEAIRGKRDK